MGRGGNEGSLQQLVWLLEAPEGDPQVTIAAAAAAEAAAGGGAGAGVAQAAAAQGGGRWVKGYVKTGQP